MFPPHRYKQVRRQRAVFRLALFFSLCRVAESTRWHSSTLKDPIDPNYSSFQLYFLYSCRQLPASRPSSVDPPTTGPVPTLLAITFTLEVGPFAPLRYRSLQPILLFLLLTPPHPQGVSSQTARLLYAISFHPLVLVCFFFQRKFHAAVLPSCCSSLEPTVRRDLTASFSRTFVPPSFRFYVSPVLRLIAELFPFRFRYPPLR